MEEVIINHHLPLTIVAGLPPSATVPRTPYFPCGLSAITFPTFSAFAPVSTAAAVAVPGTVAAPCHVPRCPLLPCVCPLLWLPHPAHNAMSAAGNRCGGKMMCRAHIYRLSSNKHDSPAPPASAIPTPIYWNRYMSYTVIKSHSNSPHLCKAALV